MSTFRVDTAGWFLTYPKCSLTPEEALPMLQSKGRDILEYIIAQEAHQDGTDHLHAFIRLKAKFNCKSPSFWDLGRFHGNYQAARSWKSVSAYCKKGGKFISSIDLDSKTEAEKSKRSYVAELLLKGTPLSEIVKEHPATLFEYGKLKQNWALFQADLIPALPRCFGFIPNTWGLLLPVSTIKQRHYWFWSSSPNKGKTTFLDQVEAHHPSFRYSIAELYQTPSPQAQFVFLDEYSTGHLKITQLNSMCDGTYQYPVKGSCSFLLKGSILLVCGNRSPLEIYSEPYHELIKARFNIHCLDI